MTKPVDATNTDAAITDVVAKPKFRQRQLQRLLAIFQTISNFIESVVDFASPKSAVDTSATSSAHDLRAPIKARWSLRVMVGGLVLLLVWSAIGKIDQVTRAQAQIIAAQRTQLVQSSDGGVLTQLHVKEGDVVKAGQLLATLQKERAEAAVSDSSAKVAALNITLARLHAEVYGKPLKFDKELLAYPDYIRNQTDLYNKRQTAFNDDLTSMQAILALAEDELRINRKLEKSGDVSRAEILRLQRSVADIRAQLAGKRNKYFQDAQAEMTKAQEELRTHEEALSDRKHLLSHTQLFAPTNGIVNRIKVNTLGGVLRAGEELLQISPTHSELLIEAKLKPAELAQVRVGLPATIKIDAYDYTLFGSLAGTVSYISADTLSEDTKAGEVVYYKVQVRITDAAWAGVKAKNMDIKPGLTGTLEIKSGERSVLSVLTKPISKSLSDGLRER